MVARHPAGEAGERQAGLPGLGRLIAEGFDLRIDQHGERHARLLGLLIRLAVAGLGAGAAGVDEKDDDPARDVHLRRRQAGAAGIAHGLHHVVDQPTQFGIAGIRHTFGRPAQHRMAHAGDLQNGHCRNPMSVHREGGTMGPRPAARQAFAPGGRKHRAGLRPCGRPAAVLPTGPRSCQAAGRAVCCGPETARGPAASVFLGCKGKEVEPPCM